jgi:GntR family transcriptional regulator
MIGRGQWPGEGLQTAAFFVTEGVLQPGSIAVKIDRTKPVVLHEQVAGEIRRAIAEGEAAPGERLPPARDLAAVLEVNTNTVLRALLAPSG